MNDKNIIFVDCFNTIINRKFSPNEVIYNFTEKLGEKYKIEPSVLYKIFIKTKNSLAITSKFKTGEAEYCFLNDNLGGGGILSANFSKKVIAKFNQIDHPAFLKDVYRFYLLAEQESHSLNDAVVNLLKQYKKENKKIYIVSDFYCEKVFFESWLKNLGIRELFDDIFVSCEFGCSKRSGKLYKKIITLLNLNPKDICMIGDNKKSDYLNAKKNRISAVKINNRQLKDSKTFKKKIKFGAKYNELYNVFHSQNQYNFSNFAFPLYLFTKRLYTELQNHHAKNVFFFAREGQYLKFLFDKYCEINNLKDIQSHYLRVSRNSMLLTSLKPIPQEDFSAMNCYFYITIKKFLTTLNFHESFIKQISTELNLDIDKKWKNLNKSKDFKKLLSSKIFIDEYNKKRENNREAFFSYLNSFGVDILKDGMFVVDVGWGGSIQTLLMKTLGDKIKVQGFYIGARDKTTSDIEVKTGLLYSPKRKTYRGHKYFHHDMAYYEQLLRANHNRVDEYIMKNGVGTYLLDTKVDDEKNYKNLIQPMQKRITEKFISICQLDVYKNCSLIEDYAIRAFYKMISKPTKNDYNWLFKCEDSHFDNFVIVNYNFRLVSHGLRKAFYRLSNLNFKLKYSLTAKKIKLSRAKK